MIKSICVHYKLLDAFLQVQPCHVSNTLTYREHKLQTKKKTENQKTEITCICRIYIWQKNIHTMSLEYSFITIKNTGRKAKIWLNQKLIVAHATIRANHAHK
jgi:hypothetical protein